MAKFFFKVFGLIIALLAAIAVIVIGVTFAFSCHVVVGIVALVFAVAAFIAGLITIIEYSFW